MQQKLKFYKATLLDEKKKAEEKKTEQDIEKLRLKAEISRASIQVTAYGGDANANSSSTATAQVTITIQQTIESIKSLPTNVLSDEDKEDLEDKLSAIELSSKRDDKQSTINKIGKVLKYITDKGVEVGIATLPYLGEIAKGIQTLQG